MTAQSTLLPDRYPNRDLFIADILDVSPKSDTESLEHPVFSLSKKPDMAERYYEHNGNTLTVSPSSRGLANIWDKDLLIFCISQLVAGKNRGVELSNRVRIKPYDLIVATNRNVSGNGYALLADALHRLKGTVLTIDTKNTHAFDGLIVNAVIHKNDSGSIECIDITLPDWIMGSVEKMQVLSINPDYFRLRGGLERRVYELARKHCGRQPRWSISVELLHKKTGSRSALKSFRYALGKIQGNKEFPDYRLKLDSKKDQVVFYSIKHKDSTRIEAKDAIKAMGFQVSGSHFRLP